MAGVFHGSLAFVDQQVGPLASAKLADERILVGRGSSCAIKMAVATVSKEHFSIETNQQGEVYAQVHGVNGVTINSKHYASGKIVYLMDGDIFEVSGRQFVWRAAQSPAEHSVTAPVSKEVQDNYIRATDDLVVWTNPLTPSNSKFTLVPLNVARYWLSAHVVDYETYREAIENAIETVPYPRDTSIDGPAPGNCQRDIHSVQTPHNELAVTSLSQGESHNSMFSSDDNQDSTSSAADETSHAITDPALTYAKPVPEDPTGGNSFFAHARDTSFPTDAGLSYGDNFGLDWYKEQGQDMPQGIPKQPLVPADEPDVPKDEPDVPEDEAEDAADKRRETSSSQLLELDNATSPLKVAKTSLANVSSDSDLSLRSAVESSSVKSSPEKGDILNNVVAALQGPRSPSENELFKVDQRESMVEKDNEMPNILENMPKLTSPDQFTTPNGARRSTLRVSLRNGPSFPRDLSKALRDVSAVPMTHSSPLKIPGLNTGNPYRGEIVDKSVQESLDESSGQLRRNSGSLETISKLKQRLANITVGSGRDDLPFTTSTPLPQPKNPARALRRPSSQQQQEDESKAAPAYLSSPFKKREPSVTSPLAVSTSAGNVPSIAAALSTDLQKYGNPFKNITRRYFSKDSQQNDGQKKALDAVDFGKQSDLQRQLQLERDQIEQERKQLEKEREEQRLRVEKLEQEQREREQQLREQLELERERLERAHREQQEQLERERQEQLERERQEQLERERQEQLERERQEQLDLERERLERAHREQQEQLERERQEQLERERQVQLERESQQDQQRQRELLTQHNLMLKNQQEAKTPTGDTLPPTRAMPASLRPGAEARVHVSPEETRQLAAQMFQQRSNDSGSFSSLSLTMPTHGGAPENVLSYSSDAYSGALGVQRSSPQPVSPVGGIANTQFESTPPYVAAQYKTMYAAAPGMLEQPQQEQTLRMGPTASNPFEPYRPATRILREAQGQHACKVEVELPMDGSYGDETMRRMAANALLSDRGNMRNPFGAASQGEPMDTQEPELAGCDDAQPKTPSKSSKASRRKQGTSSRDQLRDEPTSTPRSRKLGLELGRFTPSGRRSAKEAKEAKDSDSRTLQDVSAEEDVNSSQGSRMGNFMSKARSHLGLRPSGADKAKKSMTSSITGADKYPMGRSRSNVEDMLQDEKPLDVKKSRDAAQRKGNARNAGKHERRESRDAKLAHTRASSRNARSSREREASYDSQVEDNASDEEDAAASYKAGSRTRYDSDEEEPVERSGKPASSRKVAKPVRGILRPADENRVRVRSHSDIGIEREGRRRSANDRPPRRYGVRSHHDMDEYDSPKWYGNDYYQQSMVPLPPTPMMTPYAPSPVPPMPRYTPSPSFYPPYDPYGMQQPMLAPLPPPMMPQPQLMPVSTYPDYGMMYHQRRMPSYGSEYYGAQPAQRSRRSKDRALPRSRSAMIY